MKTEKQIDIATFIQDQKQQELFKARISRNETAQNSDEKSVSLSLSPLQKKIKIPLEAFSLRQSKNTTPGQYSLINQFVNESIGVPERKVRRDVISRSVQGTVAKLEKRLRMTSHEDQNISTSFGGGNKDSNLPI